MSDEVIILGAGLAGLSAAYHLGENYTIYEKESQAGGLCRSRRVSGFTFDHAVHAFYSQDEYVTALVKKLLADNLSYHRRKAFIFSSGVLTPYPFQANTFGLPLEVVRECVIGFIEAACSSDWQVRADNFEGWIYTAFGSGIAEHFMLPFNRKLWGIDLREMDACWIGNRVPQPGFVEVIGGALGRQDREFGLNAQFWYPEEGGMAALPEAFLSCVKNIRLNQEVMAIQPDDRYITLADGRRRKYGRLISSLPLNRLIEIMNPVPDRIKEAARELKYNVVYVVNIGVNRGDISHAHWIYFPESEFIFYRLSFPMNFSPAMAPEGTSSISVEVSIPADEEVDKNELVSQVIDDLILAQILKEADEILVKDLMKMEPAYIIYDHSRKRNVAVVHAFLEDRDIYPCGRFGMWEYFNMDHAILSGKLAAERAGVN